MALLFDKKKKNISGRDGDGVWFVKQVSSTVGNTPVRRKGFVCRICFGVGGSFLPLVAAMALRCCAFLFMTYISQPDTGTGMLRSPGGGLDFLLNFFRVDVHNLKQKYIPAPLFSRADRGIGSRGGPQIWSRES